MSMARKIQMARKRSRKLRDLKTDSLSLPSMGCLSLEQVDPCVFCPSRSADAFFDFVLKFSLTFPSTGGWCLVSDDMVVCLLAPESLVANGFD